MRNDGLPYYIYYDDNGKQHISTPLLARFIRERIHYILVRDNGRQGIQIYVYANGYYQLYAPDMFKGIIKQVIADHDESMVRMGIVNEVYQLLTTDLNYVSQDELNADESLINVENGLLRVTADSITLLPHSPGIYSTVRIPVTWTGKAEPTPVHDRYLNTLVDGDGGVAELIYEFMGAVFSNVKGWRMKKALFLVGPGNSGKSQEKALVERMLGKGNFIGADLKEIEARFGTGAIYGTRLAGSSDMGFLTVDELKVFKKITGGDSLFAEFKGQQGFEYTYSGLLWFCMNRLPKFGGDDGRWVYNRILVVECPNAIPRFSQDKQLQDKMYAERNGIFYKAILALQRVIRNGYTFTETKTLLEARARYQEQNNTVQSFFSECMCQWQDDRIEKRCTTGRIYKVYQAWCMENNHGHAKTAGEFREELSEYVGEEYSDMTVRRGGNTYYRDYGLTSEAKEQYASAYGYAPDVLL